MKLRQIAEAAVYVSAHSQAFIERPAARRERPLTEFWLLSRRRLHDWMAATDDFLLRSVGGGAPTPATGDGSLTALLHEMFAAELLARVWSATLAAVDRNCAADRYQRLSRNVFIGHLQARHRALSLIADGRQLPAAEILRMDQLRRRCERWTDVLVGHLVCRYGVEDFAFDAARARDFGRTQYRHGEVSPREPVWELTLAGVGVSFPDSLRLPPVPAERSRSLARVALAMFSPGVAASIPGLAMDDRPTLPRPIRRD
ncbi:MAG TPA: hypothetical protein VML55_01370 [Planctomycetaceae bacterium]|nr:hypothetical protein [Planctomycetaceae bacterium]